MRQYYIYILSNGFQSVFYTGITNNLERRMYEHGNKLIDGFTKKYKISKLLYFEECPDVKSAIEREKQIKGYNRLKKINLIRAKNSDFRDLYLEINNRA